MALVLFADASNIASTWIQNLHENCNGVWYEVCRSL